MVVFQRNAAWIEPKPDHAVSKWTQLGFKWVPFASSLVRRGLYWFLENRLPPFLTNQQNSTNERRARRHLQRQVKDESLRAKLTPTESFGCKRVLLSNDFYPAVTREHVTLETEPIRGITAKGVETSNGLHELDVLIWCTGFNVTDFNTNPLKVFGRKGRSWNQEASATAKAYLGVATEGYPNWFWLMGPHTGLGHNSMIYMIECQIDHIVAALDIMDVEGASTIEVSAGAQDRFEEEMDKKMEGTVWKSGCSAWYQDASGRISTIWPDHTYVYRDRTRTVAREDYILDAPIEREAIAS